MTTAVALRLPASWKLLPVSERGAQAFAAAIRERGAPEVAAAASDMAGLAREAGARLCAAGPLPAPAGEEEHRGAAVLAAQPPGVGVTLDDVAAILAADGFTSEVSLRIRSLPLAGPGACLGWSQPFSDDGPGWRADVQQHWVPFPEDDRTAVLTVVAVVPAGRPVPAGALERMASTLAFVEGDGRVVIPQP